MLTWNGAPLRPKRDEETIARTLRNLDVLAELAVLPPRWGWHWIDWLGARGVTDRCPEEELLDGSGD